VNPSPRRNRFRLTLYREQIDVIPNSKKYKPQRAQRKEHRVHKKEKLYVLCG
jgi:hypothetical protein